MYLIHFQRKNEKLNFFDLVPFPCQRLNCKQIWCLHVQTLEIVKFIKNLYLSFLRFLMWHLLEQRQRPTFNFFWGTIFPLILTYSLPFKCLSFLIFFFYIFSFFTRFRPFDLTFSTDCCSEGEESESKLLNSEGLYFEPESANSDNSSSSLSNKPMNYYSCNLVQLSIKNCNRLVTYKRYSRCNSFSTSMVLN
jgi:hypothetical protein